MFFFFKYFYLFLYKNLFSCQNLVYVSHSLVPTHLKISIEQTIKMNPKAKIFLVGENIKIDGQSLNIFDYNDLNEKACDVCVSLLNRMSTLHKGNKKYFYYINTMKRYISVFLLMKQLNLTNVFQIESDVMIYGNFSNLLNTLQKCEVDISFPGNVGSIVFFKNSRVIHKMLQNFLRTVILWTNEPIPYIHMNDMHLLSVFRETSNKSIKFVELPSNPLLNIQNCIQKSDNMTVYDPGFYGAALDGAPYNAGKPFISKKSFFKNHKDILNIRYNITNKYKIFFYKNYRLFNLHIFSKRLYLFKSN